ncbi:response regulator transcription factor [Acidisoma sp. C75]
MAETARGAIAVVDDDAAVLESYQFMLQLAGFAVMPFTSALSYLEADGPDIRCMILDHHMPQMTGLELVERLRARAQDFPILLVTAAPTAQLRARAAALGVVKVLEKPPNEEELLRFVSCRA